MSTFMSILPLIFWAAALIGAVYVLSLCLTVVFEYINGLIEKIKSRLGSRKVNKDCVAVIVKEHIANGRINVISGVFNKTDNTLVDEPAKWETEKLDFDLENEFMGNDCVTYTIT